MSSLSHLPLPSPPLDTHLISCCPELLPSLHLPWGFSVTCGSSSNTHPTALCSKPILLPLLSCQVFSSLASCHVLSLGVVIKECHILDNIERREMYLITALKAASPRHNAAICLASSEGLPAALPHGRRWKRKKKEAKFRLLGREEGKEGGGRELMQLANLFLYHVDNI